MEPVKGKVASLQIYALEDGGYVVRECSDYNTGHYSPPLFASTTLNEVLTYIRKRLEWTPLKVR